MDFNILTDCPLFKGLYSDDIESIFSVVPYRIKRFTSGSLLFQSGDLVNYMIVVTGGVLKGEMVDVAGRIIKIEDIPAPGALASAFMFGNRNRFPVNVIAVSDGELLLIDKPDFLKLFMRNDVILVNFLDMISNRSQFLSEKIKFLNFKTIKGKLANYLLQKAGKDLHVIKLDMTQNELADYFGVARPSVGRTLGELESEGYIEANGKTIRIIDREGLAELTYD
jgi:CRP/FNR family transcriptional regulator, dissimilatory nitrate respiration regulator